jgi:autotransporter translocation and assembly factor TamB
VRAQGGLSDGVLDGRFEASSPAARFAASGAADLRADAWRDLRLGLALLRDTPFGPGATAAAGTRLTALVNGPMAGSALAYRLSTPRLAIGGAAFEGLEASGSGRRTGSGAVLPLAATARRVTNGGAELLGAVRLTGTVSADGDRIGGRGLSLAADRLRSTFAFDADLGTGRVSAAGRAASEDYRLAGLGVLDVTGDWRAVNDGSGFRLAGDARGLVRRYDNEALEWAAGGPLRFQSRLEAAADGAVRLSALRLAAPRLQLGGEAVRTADGSLSAEAAGRQASLGPLSLRFQGSRLSLLLARPSPSLGLANVRVEVEPAAQGFGYRASGGSPLGPFAARGLIAARGGRAAVLQVAALDVSGARASGALRPGGGGVAGRLDFRGRLSGPLVLGASGGRQSIDAELVASDARLGRVPIGSGRMGASIRIDGGGGLSGRVRLDGAADRLWAMTGIEGAALAGGFVAEADLGGITAAPRLAGTLAMENGRFASAATGADIRDLDLRGRFDERRLVIEALSADTEGGGRIGGQGEIGFGGALDLRLETRDALLFARPDARARVTGPVRIRSEGRGRHDLGRAAAYGRAPAIRARRGGRRQRLYRSRRRLAACPEPGRRAGRGRRARARQPLERGAARRRHDRRPRFYRRSDADRGQLPPARKQLRAQPRHDALRRIGRSAARHRRSRRRRERPRGTDHGPGEPPRNRLRRAAGLGAAGARLAGARAARGGARSRAAPQCRPAGVRSARIIHVVFDRAWESSPSASALPT